MISGLPRNFYNFYKNKYDDCGDEFFWKEVMTELSLLKVNNLLVEGGEKVITSLINFKLIDELIIVRVPKLWGERGRSFISAINNIITAELVEKINLDDNIIDKYKIIY
jgi:riboflavin biosynthesis pyrimidine reductase